MTAVTHPPKEIVRAVMQKHQREKTLPKTIEDYRRELNWNMLPNNNRAERTR